MFIKCNNVDGMIIWEFYDNYQIVEWYSWFEFYHNGKLIYTTGKDDYDYYETLNEIIDDIPFSEYF